MLYGSLQVVPQEADGRHSKYTHRPLLMQTTTADLYKNLLVDQVLA